jgi:hypothetical protein
MNPIIKELRSLAALCYELNLKTKYSISFNTAKARRTLVFDVIVRKDEINEPIWIAMVEFVTLENLKKARRELKEYVKKNGRVE